MNIFSQKDTLNIINTLKKDLKVLNEGTYIYGSYLSNIGYFALQKNKFDEARSYLKQAILHNKKFPSLLGIDFHNHSVLHIKESRIDSALIYHKLSLLVYDDALYAHLDQCEDFQKLDEKTLSRFLAIDNEAFDPKSSALYDKAMLLKDKGKTKKSIKILKEALNHEKGNLNRSDIISFIFQLLLDYLVKKVSMKRSFLLLRVVSH